MSKQEEFGNSMREIIINSKNQLREGLKRAKDVKAEGTFSKVIVCGMGGSALPANLLKLYLPKLPIFSHRDYNLPEIADKKSLILCISYSGNTEEALSAHKEAKKKGFKTIAITTGGKLKEMEENIVLIPKKAEQPRFATGYLFGASVKILSNSGIIPNKDKEILNTKIEPLKYEEKGKQLANKLMNKIPIVYASNRFKSLARIWKIKFNENSKIMAFFNYFPELNHNEMVGLTNLKGDFHFLILQSEKDNKKNLKRMELFKKLAQKRKAEVEIIKIKGKNILEQIFNNLVLGEWTSYYLALQYNQDPVPVEIVEEFKEKL